MSDNEKWSVEFGLTRLEIRRYIMVKQDALMESLSSNLHEFLNQIQGDLSGPRLQALVGYTKGSLHASYGGLESFFSEVLNIDETGWKDKGVKYWAWVFCTPILRCSCIAKSLTLAKRFRKKAYVTISHRQENYTGQPL